MSLLLAYSIFVSVVFYIMLCGTTRYHRDGYVGMANRALMDGPGHMASIMCVVVCCGKERGHRAFDVLNARLTRRRNPTLQVLYCVLTFPAIAAFAYYVWPLLRNVSHTLYISTPVAISILLATFVIGCRSDAGCITDATLAGRMNDVYHHDNYLYPSTASCKTCTFVKPPRSKHCAVCGHCVLKFDHHCGWLNTDVGQNNMRHFLAFLISHWFGCGICCFACFVVLRDYTIRNRLFEAQFRDAVTDETYSASYGMVARYIVTQFYGPVVVMLFAGSVAVLLFFFFLHHMRNVLRNLTSNEAARVDELEYYFEMIAAGEHDEAQPPHYLTIDVKTDATQLAKGFSVEAVKATYFVSYAASLKEMLFPPSLLPPLPATKQTKKYRKK